MRLYTVREAAGVLRTSSNTVYDLIKKGAIIPLRLGRLKVSEQEPERFVNENQGRDLGNPGRRYD